MPYVVGTDPCSYLLSDDGICVRVQATGNTQVSSSAQTPQTAVVGAQFVAGLDVTVPGGLVGGLEIGSAALFVKQDEDGRFVLLRTAPIRTVTERGLKKKPQLPKSKVEGDETTLTQIKTSIPRPPPLPRVATPAPTASDTPPPRAISASHPAREPGPLAVEPPTAKRSVDPETVRRASAPSIPPPPPPLPKTIVPPAMRAPSAPEIAPTPPRKVVERDASGVPVEAIPKGTRPDLPAPPIFHLSNQSRPMAPSVFPSPWDEPPTHRLMRDDMRKGIKKKKK